MHAQPSNVSAHSGRCARTTHARRWTTLVLATGIAVSALVPVGGVSGAQSPTGVAHRSTTHEPEPDCFLCVL